MITINSNASAMMAQNNLFNAQSALTGNMQQLSTGLRINSASDDAAGMQISNRMETQMNGLGVAQRNSNDAISMAQTAEGAMTENVTMLNRMRDLAMQSANGSNTQDDRDAMQKEVESLVSEIDRIAESTNFAGINLLDGEDGNAKSFTFQVGPHKGDTIGFDINSMRSEHLGQIDAGLDNNMFGGGFTGSFSADETLGMVTEFAAGEAVEFTIDGQMISVEGVPGVPGVPGEPGGPGIAPAEGEAAFVRALNNAINEDPYLADMGISADINDDNQLTFTANSSITISNSDRGPITLRDESAGKSALNVSEIDISSVEGAQRAIEILDVALKEVDEQRADLGAVQNRLESTISNLSNIEENLGVSQSRILDADFASQTVEMTSNQMLMQAGTSILAQAKGMPQYATMLL